MALLYQPSPMQSGDGWKIAYCVDELSEPPTEDSGSLMSRLLT